jgi:hypothetical protein
VWRLSFLSGFFAGAALFGCLLMVLASPCFDIGLAVLPAASCYWLFACGVGLSLI